MATKPFSSTGDGPRQPWWRIRMVWLVIAGPLLVVLASFVTLGIAVKHIDPVLTDTNAAESFSDKPAIQARNHAATQGEGPKKEAEHKP